MIESEVDMETFLFKAKRMDGTIVSGVLDAADEVTLIQQLREEGLYCYEIKVNKDKKSLINHSKMKEKELAAFCQQLAALLSSGISLTKALSICQDSANAKLKKVLYQVNLSVQKGNSLSVAMKSLGNTFPQLLIFMVETGEVSGKLDEMMQKMSEHYNQRVQITSKVQTAMIYPVVLLIISVMATIFLLTFVLPQFITMFENVELPMITKMLIWLSTFIKENALMLIIVCFLIIGICSWLYQTKKVKAYIHKKVLVLPIVGKLVCTLYTSQFATTFSILYGSGVGVLKSIDITSRVLGNSYIATCLEEASFDMQTGAKLSEALKQMEVFQPMFISMIQVGEESGTLENMLEHTGNFYSKEAQQAIGKLVAFVEPVMILIMGAIISVIVLSIMIPMFRMYSTML